MLPINQALKKHVGLVDEDNGNICHCFIAAHFHSFAVIGIIEVGGTKPACLQSLFAIFIPNGEFAHSQVIFIVLEQFLQTCFSHISEL